MSTMRIIIVEDEKPARDLLKAYLQDIPRTLQYLCDVGSQYEQCKQFAELVQNKIKPAVEQSIK